MIPATKANKTCRTVGVRKGAKMKYPNIAPIGSVSPDIKDTQKA